LDSAEFGAHDKAHLKNSVTLHYVSHGPRDKPLMILIHGFPEFWYSWRHQLTAFGDNYRVIAYDQRGYGESDKPGRISDYSIDKLTLDVKDLIEFLGYSKAVVVGHDFGGAVAWSFAARFPEHAEKLIALNFPHPNAFQNHFENDRGQFLKSWYMFFFQLPYLPEWFLKLNDFNFLSQVFTGKSAGCRRGQITSLDMDAYKYTFAMGGFTGPVNFYRAAMQLAKSSQAKKPIKAPILLIWGENDAYLSKEMAVNSERFCEDFRLKFIEPACHFVQQDYPEEVNKVMRAFLSIPSN